MDATPSRFGLPPRGDRGASAVEFALVSSVLFTVLIGMLQYGLFFNDALSTRQGVREAARLGVVRNFPTCGGQSTDITKLHCYAKSQIETAASAKYVRVVKPASWKRGQPLLVCAMVHADTIGLLPMPSDGWVQSE